MKLVRWLPATAWAAVIFGLSAQPGNRLPGGFSTLAHFVAYAVLGALIAVAVTTDWGWQQVLLATLLASLYGVTDEWHQSFVPLRTPDPLDWLVDTIGALVGATLITLAVRRRRASMRDAQ